MSPRPVADPAKCTGCGACAMACPEHSIRIVRGKARFRHGRCALCRSCIGICPEGAIELA